MARRWPTCMLRSTTTKRCSTIRTKPVPEGLRADRLVKLPGGIAERGGQEIHQPPRLHRTVLAGRIHLVDAEPQRDVSRPQFHKCARPQVGAAQDRWLQTDAPT